MTGKEIFESLPVEVRDKIRPNIVSDHERYYNIDEVEDFIKYVMGKHWSTKGFIGALFEWSSSPEGHDYWEKIANS